MQPKTIFEKNLDELKSNYLKNIILNHKITESLQVKNTNGFNLEYNGIFFHNEKSPLGEAQFIFNNMNNTPASIQIIYGIGLGYLFQYTAINSKGTVILYEPNLDILKTAFTLVDFSNELSKQNVYVAITKNALNEILRNHMGFENYPTLHCLPSYLKLFKEQIETDKKELSVLIGSIMLDSNYTKTRYYPVTRAIINNIPYLSHEIPLCNIQDCYKGQTAVVVSAGPTLYENIETLKKYQDNVVILCVGPAYRALVSAGIKPDFLCIIEDRNCIGQISGLDISEVNLIIEPATHNIFHKLKPKKTFLHISNNLPPNKIWADIAGLETKEYNSRGTVSYCALNSARILGCDTIILVGQDLGYLDNRLYSKDSAYGDLKLVFNETTKNYEVIAENMQRFAEAMSTNKEKQMMYAKQRLAQYNGKITTIKSISGDLIPTDVVYTTFAANISKFPKLYPGRKYINTSMKGALLDGFENIPLDKALEGSTPVKKKDFSDLTFDKKDEIITNLEKIKNSFAAAITAINDNQKLLSRFKTEYNRRKCLTKDMLATLKKIISNYTWLSINFSQKNPVFDFITKKEQMVFETFLSKSENIDLPAALRIAELQSKYLTEAIEKTASIQELINKDIELLKENLQ